MLIADFVHEWIWPAGGSGGIWGDVAGSMLYVAVAAAVVTVVYKPALRAVERFVKRHADSIKAHVTSEHNAVHEKLDHIIKHHPAIPPFAPSSVPTVTPQYSSSTTTSTTPVVVWVPPTITTKEKTMSLLDTIEARFRAIPRLFSGAVDDAEKLAHSTVAQKAEAFVKDVLPLLPDGSFAEEFVKRVQEGVAWAHQAIANVEAATGTVVPPAAEAPAPTPAPVEAAPAPAPAPTPVVPAPVAETTAPAAATTAEAVPSAPVPAAAPPVAPTSPVTPPVLFTFTGDSSTVDATLWPKASVVTDTGATLYTWAGAPPAPVSAEWVVYSGVTNHASGMIIPVSSAAAGDLVACHSRGAIGSAIRLDQWLMGDTWQRYGLEVPDAAADEPWMWNHFAILDRLVDGEWTVIQAEAHGVTGTDSGGKPFLAKPLSTVAPGGRFEIVQLPAGCERCRVLSMARGEVGAQYGFVSVASIVATELTPRALRLDFRRGGTWICSALAAEAMRAGGWYHQWPDVYQVRPAQLYGELAA